MQVEGFAILPLTAEQSRRAGLMEGAHRDPFDRLIAAQAMTERLTLITRDQALSAFGVETLW